jgi:flagellar basal body-associated protein FliL
MPPEAAPVPPLPTMNPSPHTARHRALWIVLLAIVVVSALVWAAWYFFVLNGPEAQKAREAAKHEQILKSVPVNPTNAKLAPEDKAKILEQFDAKVKAQAAATTTPPVVKKP